MLNIKPFKQTNAAKCGPASVKMVLDFYGIDVSEDTLCVDCNYSYELGCTNRNMVRALEKYGVNAELISNSSLSALQQHVNTGTPVIVDWFTPGVVKPKGFMPNGHASVVIGVDDKYVHMVDPENGQRREILKDEFVRVWFDWTGSPYIDRWEDMSIRTMIVPHKQMTTPAFALRMRSNTLHNNSL